MCYELITDFLRFSAVNSIMRSMKWDAGGVILYLSSAYAMVKNTAAWLASVSQDGSVENIEGENSRKSALWFFCIGKMLEH